MRLRALREQYVAQLALYTPKHPSVASLKREIYGLELQTGGGDAAIEILDRIEDGYTQLAAARQARPPDEAEIQRLEVLVGDVVNQYKNLPIRGGRDAASTVGGRQPGVRLHPGAAPERGHRALACSRRGAASWPRRIADLERRQFETPAVEAEYSALQRELQSEQTKFADVRQKLLDAQLAREPRGRAEGRALHADRAAAGAAGAGAGPTAPRSSCSACSAPSASAVGLMLLLEVLDTRVRGRRQVVSLVGVPPLAIIPWVAEEEKRRFAALRRLAFWRRSSPVAAAAGA